MTIEHKLGIAVQALIDIKDPIDRDRRVYSGGGSPQLEAVVLSASGLIARELARNALEVIFREPTTES